VTGVFDSGFYDYDANWCFVKMDAAQALAGAADVVNVLEFRLKNPEVARRLHAKSATGRNRFCGCHLDGAAGALFRALRLEKLVTAIFYRSDHPRAGLNILVSFR